MATIAVLGIGWFVAGRTLPVTGFSAATAGEHFTRLDVAASALAILAGSAYAVRWKIDGYAPSWWIGNALVVGALPALVSNAGSHVYVGLHFASGVVAGAALVCAIRSPDVDTAIHPVWIAGAGAAGVAALYAASSARLDAATSRVVLGILLLAVGALAVRRARRAPDGPWRAIVPYVTGLAVIDVLAGAAPPSSAVGLGGATAVRLAATLFPLAGAVIDLRAAAALQRAAAYGESLQREAAEVLARATEERFAETLHEVRSTVVALEGGVRCLLPADESLPAPLARALSGEVERLRSLVCDDTDRTAIRYRATDALEPVLTIARAGGVPLSWRVPADVWIQGRAADLAQIVHSLLANATRHAPGSPIEVTIEQDGTHVGVRVSDRGPGVPVSEAERIFSRGERGREAAAKGEGLGLYIARNVARTAGGDLWVEPRLGGGATFVVALPAGDGVAGRAEVNHATPALRALPRPVPRRRGRQAQQQAWNFS